MSFRWNNNLRRIIWLYLIQSGQWNRPLMKWNRHLMKSNHINGVKWFALCLHVTNDSHSLKKAKKKKKKNNLLIVITNFYAYFRAIPLGPIDFGVCLHVTFFFSNLFTYKPHIVWCRFNVFDACWSFIFQWEISKWDNNEWYYSRYFKPLWSNVITRCLDFLAIDRKRPIK